MLNPLLHPICLAEPQRSYLRGAWREHIPFGMMLIDLLRPRTLVELGTFRGISYCAFCQAIKALGTKTQCHAIDHWAGDNQAGYYGPDVFEELQAYHDPRYGTFSTLVRASFEEAAVQFPAGSIDLLHIDGHHSYEAVKDNFDTWIEKMSDRGVVLFHDIHEFREGFGVHRFWAELKLRYPTHFEFQHGHGLGVLSVGDVPSLPLRALFDSTPAEAKILREFFRQIGQRLTCRRSDS